VTQELLFEESNSTELPELIKLACVEWLLDETKLTKNRKNTKGRTDGDNL
jgi:hypothetical protein